MFQRFAWLSLGVLALCGRIQSTEPVSFQLAGLKLLPEPWHKAANYAKLETYVHRAAAAGADFIVTPEGYLEGYVGNAADAMKRPGAQLTRERYLEVAEPVDGPWMRKIAGLAAGVKKHLLVGFAERRGDGVYNTVALFSPEGRIIAKYSKSHLGNVGTEPFNERGSELPVFPTALGKLGLLVCFDRQMPETSRILAIKGAQIILVPAFGLGSSEISEDVMMRTRAYENAVYVAHVHPKNTFIVDPKGVIIAQSRGEQETIVMARVVLDGRIGANGAIKMRRPEIYGEILNKPR